ncbi:2-nitropropane dioxygenase [Phaffia rhodozyma]|uniref:2-nitropropane dioxygenase n=1 Tax=Phaffia rhodozyma TaxID=264483 RepID=A0A0F7SQX4_PHARH|nr:2-nitropropane dioxygenase [Phaffia rhodozyma]
MSVLQTPITKMFNIQHPVMLAGMNVAAGPELAAAVSNAGGLGVIGGLGLVTRTFFKNPPMLNLSTGYTPKNLRNQIREIKKHLKSPDLPFGVDLLIPKVGDGARATNYDYTKYVLFNFFSPKKHNTNTYLPSTLLRVPPKSVVDKLHEAKIPIMNMIGHPKHVAYALNAGVDIICAQGGEGGGHTGNIPTSLLIPACVDLVKGKTSPLTGEPIRIVAAGGIYDGRGLAAALMWGASAVWVGTRFVAAVEASAPKKHKDLILSAGYDDVEKTLIYTGRPLRVRATPYVKDWNNNRADEIKKLTSQGTIPHDAELEKKPEKSMEGRSWLMGTVAGAITEVLPAQKIVEDMVNDAKACIKSGSEMAKL